MGAVTGATVSWLNHVMHRLTISEDDYQLQLTKEEQVLKALSKYKIGDEIDIDDFGSLVPSEAKLAIKKIVRVSETNFKVVRSWYVKSNLIAEDAVFKIEKKGSIDAKTGKITGLKITPYGLRFSTVEYPNSVTHTFNEFILDGNKKVYKFNGRIYSYSKK
ncbi:hypothetical protein [Flavobacterium aurantiibacter]|uniref:Uncharacterized protein n=1 Tax=Flavobacterium aurantiibacter TaxID=2023067 RepID=A0A256A8L1_9FLAO|nr:hypothetical protein [Flavobacterium aurantiibacter]OYQ50038.1 hypothetical protein CHX27_01020 [Flavobacterium aurantiibacter]